MIKLKDLLVLEGTISKKEIQYVKNAFAGRRMRLKMGKKYPLDIVKRQLHITPEHVIAAWERSSKDDSWPYEYDSATKTVQINFIKNDKVMRKR